MTYNTLKEIKAANAAAGQHFFEPATMRFFNSRVSARLIAGRYFISSERFDETTPRRYTVRIANDDGTIDTVGEFQQYPTMAQARAAAEALEAVQS